MKIRMAFALSVFVVVISCVSFAFDTWDIQAHTDGKAVDRNRSVNAYAKFGLMIGGGLGAIWGVYLAYRGKRSDGA